MTGGKADAGSQEEKRKLDKHFDAAFGEDSFWRRQRNQVWQDLLQANPIMRCYDNEDLALPSITANKLTKVLHT